MNKSDTRAFELNLDVKSAVPIYEQIKDAIKMTIFTGKLREGDKIISIRDVAARNNINPITILKAYNQLEHEGFLYSRRGAGYFVQMDQKKIREGRKEIFRQEISKFLKRMAGLGFTMKEFLAELEKYMEEK